MPTWANKRPEITLGGAALAAAALLVFLWVQTQDFGARREADVLTRLLNANAIDTRWDMAISDARAGAPARFGVLATDVERVHAALDAAVREIPTRVMQATVEELKRAYSEKADLIARLVQASADSQQALAAAMRADAAIGTQVRAAWREFPQRERLVAAENLVARTLAEAQAYSRTPTPEHRASLQTYAVDLSRARELPRTVQATLERLEADIHQLLLLKPLEQTTDARLTALRTGGYLEELTALVQRKQLDEATARAHYRVYFLLCLLVLAVVAAYAAARTLRAYDRLRKRVAEMEHELTRVPPEDTDAVADVVDLKPYRRR